MFVHYPDPQSFAERYLPGHRQPVVIEMPLDGLTPIEIYTRVRKRFGSAVLLESGKNALRSYIGIVGSENFVVDGNTITTTRNIPTASDPFEALRSLIDGERVVPNERLGAFSGGYVGYLAYDMARHIERLPSIATTRPRIPDCQFVLVDTFCEIDHGSNVLRLAAATVGEGSSSETLARTLASIERLRSAIVDVTGDSSAPTTAESNSQSDSGSTLDPDSQQSVLTHRVATSNMTQVEFEAIAGRAKEYILAGDIFQVNLSIRFEMDFDDDPVTLYRALRGINPAPFMALLELPGVSIVSASPELLLRVRGRAIETRPIAGTRPRGASEEEDERNARKLSENEKERAEHLMLVDLERNDIGRVARYGSVNVDEFMGIERYSHVIHIVSNVRGELAEDRDVIDAIRSCFPGGTITGAPKVRSMEIIEELEPHRRGVYTGSIGWIGFDGNAELNIAIRTIVIVDGKAYAQAGAGIVADSEPHHEYRESLRKVEAALEALRVNRS